MIYYFGNVIFFFLNNNNKKGLSFILFFYYNLGDIGKVNFVEFIYLKAIKKNQNRFQQIFKKIYIKYSDCKRDGCGFDCSLEVIIFIISLCIPYTAV